MNAEGPLYQGEYEEMVLECISIPISSRLWPQYWLPTFLGPLCCGRWCALGTVHLPGFEYSICYISKVIKFVDTYQGLKLAISYSYQIRKCSLF